MKTPEVLLLDDEPIVGNRLHGRLEKMGCRVEVFQEPLLALERVKEHCFDVVVTDIMMDKVNGIQVLEQVRKACAKTKVIIITGFATTDLAREAMEKGAFDMIAKPFRPGDLRAMVQRALQELGFSLENPEP
jgi:DNA-binding NtrC family response regulator